MSNRDGTSKTHIERFPAKGQKADVHIIVPKEPVVEKENPLDKVKYLHDQELWVYYFAIWTAVNTAYENWDLNWHRLGNVFTALLKHYKDLDDNEIKRTDKAYEDETNEMTMFEKIALMLNYFIPSQAFAQAYLTCTVTRQFPDNISTKVDIQAISKFPLYAGNYTIYKDYKLLQYKNNKGSTFEVHTDTHGNTVVTFDIYGTESEEEVTLQAKLRFTYIKNQYSTSDEFMIDHFFKTHEWKKVTDYDNSGVIIPAFLARISTEGGLTQMTNIGADYTSVSIMTEDCKAVRFDETHFMVDNKLPVKEKTFHPRFAHMRTDGFLQMFDESDPDQLQFEMWVEVIYFDVPVWSFKVNHEHSERVA